MGPAGWGDDEGDGPALNPYYGEERYERYGSSVRRNLRRLDEDRIDFDMLEDLVTHVDAEYDEGAILVFLPGQSAA